MKAVARLQTLEAVQGQLGHTSRDSTERYAHLAPSALAAAARDTSVGDTSARDISTRDTSIQHPSALDTPAISQRVIPHNRVSPRNPSAPPARIGLATFGSGNRC
jgi:hypothetical protein